MKTFVGEVVSTKMQNTVVVRIEHMRAHPLYQKTIKRHHALKADTNGHTISDGDIVSVAETRPLSRQKRFKVIEVIKHI